MYFSVSFFPCVFMYYSDKKKLFFFLPRMFILGHGMVPESKEVLLLQLEQKCSSTFIMHVQHVFLL